jgi:outer membrane protein OmpA-like peptidoglycan-associated protein
MSTSNINKCKNTFCKEYYKKMIEISTIIIKVVLEKKKDKYKELDKVKLKIEKEKDKLIIKELKDKLKSKNFKEEVMEICKNSFCNPKCKGTIFQNNKFPDELTDKYKKEKYGDDVLKELIKFRKTIFKNKKSVLKDDFYEKLKNISKLKKKGAISGCATYSIL